MVAILLSLEVVMEFVDYANRSDLTIPYVMGLKSIDQ